MALPVDVSSIDVLQSVREALLLFGDDAKNALGNMEMEIRHCVDWLTNEQRIHWQDQIKKRKEKLAEAQAELHRKQLSQMYGGQSHDSEQRENVREAKHRLEEAMDKLETVRRWVPELQRAVMEYDGIARNFSDMLEFDLLRSVEMMERMIIAIEEYTRLEAPQTNPARDGGVATSVPVSTVPTATTGEANPNPKPVANPPHPHPSPPAAEPANKDEAETS